MENIEKGGEKESGKLITQIEPKEDSGWRVIRNKEMISEMVELPLIDACKGLYEKNIETVSTSANRKDVEDADPEKGPRAYIEINKESMSKENMEILRSVRENLFNDYTVEGFDDDSEKTVMIYIPFNENSSVDEIRIKAENLAEMFKKQEPLWISNNKERYIKSRETLEKEWNVEESTREDWENEGYYYDAEEGLFYESEEIYKKHKGLI